MARRCTPVRRRSKSRSRSKRTRRTSRSTASCFADIGGGMLSGYSCDSLRPPRADDDIDSDEQKHRNTIVGGAESGGVFEDAYAVMTDSSGPMIGAAKRFAYTGCVFAKTWFRWQKSDTWFSYVIRMLVGIAILAFCLRYCMSQSKLIKRYYNRLTWMVVGTPAYSF